MTAGPVTERGTVVEPTRGVPSGVRRARVAVTQVDPWSVMKLSFVLSIGLAIVTMIAVALLYEVLDGTGTFDALSKTIGSVAGNDTGFRVQDVVTMSLVLRYALVIALIDIVLLTALSTLAAFLFNLCTGLVGGIDVTLTESD